MGAYSFPAAYITVTTPDNMFGMISFDHLDKDENICSMAIHVIDDTTATHVIATTIAKMIDPGVSEENAWMQLANDYHYIHGNIYLASFVDSVILTTLENMDL